MEKRMSCHCEKCGNEAEMIVQCELIEVEASQPAAGEKKQKEIRTCTVCGNEAEMIVNLE